MGDTPSFQIPRVKAVQMRLPLRVRQNGMRFCVLESLFNSLLAFFRSERKSNQLGNIARLETPVSRHIHRQPSVAAAGETHPAW